MRSTHDHGTTDGFGDVPGVIRATSLTSAINATSETDALGVSVAARRRRRLTAVAAGVTAALALGGLSTVPAHGTPHAPTAHAPPPPAPSPRPPPSASAPAPRAAGTPPPPP
ncbi:hypothetical protein [Streptomyces sp. 8ZJF_21]|uniref:hypothetical protein n=1 Tax=Streptomyces sp. 8ZJF_21 TaxID=2903141 RepID=UPI001E558A52|nr:hypothetical protein [Streptomyces sp. 8ZJF_21]MCD9588999.1 hypothetical protein [Streptomyces sp. 8ZJF_21]